MDPVPRPGTSRAPVARTPAAPQHPPSTLWPAGRRGSRTRPAAPVDSARRERPRPPPEWSSRLRRLASTNSSLWQERRIEAPVALTPPAACGNLKLPTGSPMRISAKAEYAARAVLYLSACYPRLATISEIADCHHIPLKYLEQILLMLKKAGIVESRRGVYGGYTLGRPPQQISVAEV